ncbi:MAG: heme ABC exporter ATP-binding protein CcmA [Halobacteriota archaeon]|nr:heme ABC exporter ATP-binding protein CcmA [Halobacteriota archaeon]
MTQNMIEIRDVTKKFGTNTVLDGVSLQIQKGDSFALIGPNGAGKTTLVRILSTLSNPNSGTIIINGFDINEDQENVRGQIGVISHNTFLYEDLTAQENLEFYAELYSIGKEEGQEKIDQLLRKVNLRLRAHDIVGTFSRGMKQRLAIARMVLHDPNILILDEPSTGLDVKSRNIFYEIVKDLHSTGKTVLLATHDLKELEILCDKLAIMNGGKILLSGEVEKIKEEQGKSLENIFMDLTGGD